MIFKDLLKQTTPKEIKKQWDNNYEAKLSIGLATDLKQRLLNKELKEPIGTLVVDSHDAMLMVDEELQNVSFVDWGILLNTEVECGNIVSEKAVTYILYEMTWNGFYEDDMKIALQRLKQRLQDVQEGEAKLYEFKGD